MTRLHVTLLVVALQFAFLSARAQDLRQLLLLESRAFLDEHLKKLDSWDPSALDDYAPNATRILSNRRGGGDAQREQRGVELRRAMTREMNESKARHEQFTYSGFTVALIGSSVQHCAKPTLKAPPPAPPPPPAGQPAAAPPRLPPRPPTPERVCWTIGAPSTAGYKILEVAVQLPP